MVLFKTFTSRTQRKPPAHHHENFSHVLSATDSERPAEDATLTPPAQGSRRNPDRSARCLMTLSPVYGT